MKSYCTQNNGAKQELAIVETTAQKQGKCRGCSAGIKFTWCVEPILSPLGWCEVKVKPSLITIISDNDQDKPETTYTTKHGTVATMKTLNIGKKKQEPVTSVRSTYLMISV